MSFFYNFPSDLIVSILAYWCDITNVVRNDSATSNYPERFILMSSYLCDGFAVNNKKFFKKYLKHSCVILDAIEWVQSKNIKLSNVTFNVFYGIPSCPITAAVLFRSNTSSITELSFSSFPTTMYTAVRKHLFSKTIQFINSCHHLKALQFSHRQQNNQYIVKLHPNILTKLQKLQWSSCNKLFQQKSTISVLSKHCKSLTDLNLSYDQQPEEYEPANEDMLINLLTNNKNLKTLQFVCVTTTTQRLLGSLFNHCKLITSLTVKSKNTHGDCNLLLKWIHQFLLNSPSICIIINESFFSRLPVTLYNTRENFHFKNEILSKELFDDLILLSQTPGLKYHHLNERLLYNEDQFIVCA
jgi:hypothetical protein